MSNFSVVGKSAKGECSGVHSRVVIPSMNVTPAIRCETYRDMDEAMRTTMSKASQITISLII